MSVSQENKDVLYECHICYYRTDSRDRLDAHMTTHYLLASARQI